MDLIIKELKSLFKDSPAKSKFLKQAVYKKDVISVFKFISDGENIHCDDDYVFRKSIHNENYIVCVFLLALDFDYYKNLLLQQFSGVETANLIIDFITVIYFKKISYANDRDQYKNVYTVFKKLVILLCYNDIEFFDGTKYHMFELCLMMFFSKSFETIHTRDETIYFITHSDQFIRYIFSNDMSGFFHSNIHINYDFFIEVFNVCNDWEKKQIIKYANEHAYVFNDEVVTFLKQNGLIE